MILIGLGANLSHPRWGPPHATLSAALAMLKTEEVAILARSSWYRSAPVPISGQPWFTNAVASVATRLAPSGLLALMQRIEAQFGRARGAPNAARRIDLDLLDYDGQQLSQPELILPHPRLHQRRFVLEPLSEIAPQWRHPIFGLTSAQLLNELGQQQSVERLTC